MVKKSPNTLKYLTVVAKIQFGISGSHQTKPNNTEQMHQYSVNSVRSTGVNPDLVETFFVSHFGRTKFGPTHIWS